MKDVKKLSTEEKIDIIFEKIVSIDRKINPPLWKKITQWCFNHIFVVIALIILGYFVWELRDIIQNLLSVSEKIETEYREIKNILPEKSVIESLKFWK